ncbi:biotin/lipoyl-containing protein [Actinomadura chokoriensis]|uniref:biotin/lipoyl-containing protein n=1 Tax=Actinomadura chokoriensis TaxID=454156 RepID=UPI0031F78142
MAEPTRPTAFALHLRLLLDAAGGPSYKVLEELSLEKVDKGQAIRHSTLGGYLRGTKTSPLKWRTVEGMLAVCRDLVRQNHSSGEGPASPSGRYRLPTPDDLGEDGAWFELWRDTRPPASSFRLEDSPLDLEIFGLPFPEFRQRYTVTPPVSRQVGDGSAGGGTAPAGDPGAGREWQRYVHAYELPDLGGEYPATVKVIEWRARPGQIVRAEQPIVAVDINDATTHVFPSAWTGVLLEICVPEGEEAQRFTPLYRVLEAWSDGAEGGRG